ncbi:helix-turn-helix domain-containing protein [Mycobacteroides abscessus]|uniref:helix-turn-helix domain-containing protein n=1 Tax=Mycobacteroides abscessus TaxID=36809 RepID=UPI000C2573C6|nr:helix-turn-helix domain-containing protein [Mycobacteroides abscessus]AWG55019.1 DNA-binding protein [Mycobacteroides abscessus]MDQ8119601.1 helix-turn-helix domain-containing protein [Mycobacteroides abscessus subsp. massiliense]
METLVAPRGLFDREQAAEFLSTSARRVDELRRTGVLRAVRDGREFKFTNADLLAYIDGLPASA